jgi:hypothetical protein
MADYEPAPNAARPPTVRAFWLMEDKVRGKTLLAKKAVVLFCSRIVPTTAHRHDHSSLSPLKFDCGEQNANSSICGREIKEFRDAEGKLADFVQPLRLPQGIFYPRTALRRFDGSVEISAQELFDCLTRAAVALEEEGLRKHDSSDLPWKYIDSEPKNDHRAISASVLDAGPTLDIIKVSSVNYGSSDKTVDHCMSDSSSDGVDELANRFVDIVFGSLLDFCWVCLIR